MIVKNILWRFFERIGAQLIELLVTIILARILAPETFGTVALLTAFLSILQVFVDGGLGNALIQKKDADDLDFSSAFFFNIIFCVVVYVAVFLSAPYIAGFYHNNDLINMIRVAGIVVVISAVKNIQQAAIARQMLFKKFFFSTLIGTVISAIVGILLALNGFGGWALIAQYLSNALIDTIVVWIIGVWKPGLQFSLNRLKGLISVGWKLLFSNLIDNIYGNIRQLIIGKFYSPSDLAHYNRGRSLPNIIVRNVNTSIDNVLFSAMSKDQDDSDKLRELTRKAILISNFIMSPMMMTLFFAANNLVELVLTPKWLPCVLYLRIFCIIYMMQPIHTANLNVIKAVGRTDLLLNIEILKKMIGIAFLIILVPRGMKAIAYGYLVNNFFDQVINSYPSKKLIKYKYFDQLKDILPCMILAVFVGGASLVFPYFKVNLIISTGLQIIFIVTAYFIMADLLKLEAYLHFKDVVRELFKNEKNSCQS
ncbi:lipopolysaccharide biosynthesis protein [Butyrivibrio sp. WCD3002]|uniref:lipopolysaccharide biosynthesis protein n=1 Tax=Butyrivibrio sp. WCD3002 TaxID=1280676 RepID=UPI00041973F5|nr:lipopolysaccharide biosynthesis protein [Butyrivibrio sp. WCD3002]